MCKKCGPSGSNLIGISATSRAKIFPTAAALILVSFEVDAELDKVPTRTLSLLVIFSVVGRSMRQRFLKDETK